MSSDPRPQFDPTTLAPAAVSSRAAVSMSTPITVKKPRGVGSNVIEARTGNAGATFFAEPAELLEQDCDVLVPAALEQAITRENAERIRARVIVEGANGPTEAEANHILRDSGCLVVPDIYANAGGVIVSYRIPSRSTSRPTSTMRI